MPGKSAPPAPAPSAPPTAQKRYGGGPSEGDELAPEKLIDSGPTEPRANSLQNVMLVAGLGLLYICTSCGLIAFNKYLMHEDRFPFALVLVMLHMAFCAVFTGILFLIRPSLFPSLTDPDRKVNIDSELIFKGALPIAFFFSVTLVLSNVAYMHSSLAFLQMMKEANLVLVYVFSLMFALERFNWKSARILLAVIVGTTMTIHGELNFSMTGFVIQATSQVFECMKIVLQAIMLTGKAKLDVLSYVLIVSPLCLMLLTGAFGFLHLGIVPTDKNFALPVQADFEAWWPHLLANACIAFCLNVSIAMFMKHSSAVAFILAGILKDAMIVLCGCFLLKETISTMQFIGFVLQLIAILVWSLMKLHPEKFEDGICAGLRNMVMPSMAPAEKKAAADYGALESQPLKAH